MRDRLSDVLPPRKVAEVELLTSELVTNAVRHARLNEGDPIAIEIEAEPTKVRVSIIDAGAGFDVGKILRERPNHAGGWGLTLVENVADRWGIVDSPQHSVWFEIDR